MNKGNESIFHPDYVFLNVKASNRDEALKFISNSCFKLNITKSEENLYQEFLKRESLGSTGFEDGFSIPHAIADSILKPAILFIRYQDEVEWETLDNKPIRISIALIIPKNASNNHLKILSHISKQLISQKNRNSLKTLKNFEEIEKILFDNKNDLVLKNESKKLIVGITACPVGVAHTYLAAEKLTEAAIKMGYDVKIETHGSSGIENEITTQDVMRADRVIIATDIGVQIEKFAGKRVYKTNVSSAIKKPEEIIKISDEKSKILSVDNEFIVKGSNEQKTGVMKHLMAGVSYMVPMIIVGGIFLSLAIGMTKIIYGNEWLPGIPGTNPINKETHTLAGNHFLSYLNGIGGLAFTLMIPILGGYIANSIAGRSAIAPAMLASYVGNSANMFFPLGGLEVLTPTGFLGAIVIGLGVGYVTKWINTWKIPKNLKPIMPLFFMPIIVGGITSFLFIYVIGSPIGWVMNQFKTAITSVLLNSQAGIGVSIGLGFLIGAMSGFDLGGPINKIAFFTVSALVTQGVYEPMGMMATAGAVPPLAMFFSTIIFSKFFDKESKNEGISALVMGVIGIAEGAIPFAIKDPKRVIPSNVLGSGVAGALGGVFLIQDYAAHTGPIVIFLGAVPFGNQTALALLSIIIGVAITTCLYGFWLIADSPKKGSVKEIYLENVFQWNVKEEEMLKNLKLQRSNLKAQRKSLLKNSKKEMSQINLIDQGLFKIKEEISLAKSIFKKKKSEISLKYKIIRKEETLHLKARKKFLINYKNKIKDDSLSELIILKQETRKLNNGDNLNNLKKQRKIIQENYLKEIEKMEIDERKPFVDKFLNLLT